MKELAAFGPSLEDEIVRRGILLNAQQALLVRSLLDDTYREWIVHAWKEWMERGDDENEKLERAHDLIAQFQYGRLYPVKLRALLDALADEYDAHYAERDTLLLAEFLFQGYALRGAEKEDYYNPLNSNLVYVIEQRRGIPISLASIYILVGERLGLKIEGMNFPGHFLALAHHGRKEVVVDCYNGGAVVEGEGRASIVRCNTMLIAVRVLRNLMNAYERARDLENAHTMSRLLSALLSHDVSLRGPIADRTH